MKKLALILIIMVSFLCAKTDFSDMSTEELVALIGYVDAKKEVPFYEELDKRVPQMSEAQKAIYDDDKRRREDAQN